MIGKGYVFLESANSQIHYRRASPAGNVSKAGSILLLHQKPSSSQMWEPVLPLLANHGYDSVAIDLPGHGESFHPEDTEFTLPALARYISEAIPLLDFCGCASAPSIVVGHHLGAAIAMQLAVDFPEQVKKLALWGVPIMDEEAKKLLPRPPNLEDEDLKDVLKFWKMRNKLTARPGYKMPLGIRVARLVELLQSNPRATEMLFDTDVVPLLDKIIQPTLCMCGDKEMLKNQTIRAAESLHKGKLFFIPNGGIDVQDEYPEEFTDAIVGFI